MGADKLRPRRDDDAAVLATAPITIRPALDLCLSVYRLARPNIPEDFSARLANQTA